MTDWKRNKPVDDSKCVMKPTAKGWTEAVPAKVRSLRLVGHENNRPYGVVGVEVLKSVDGVFDTSLCADPDDFQMAIECFKRNELVEFKGDFKECPGTEFILVESFSDFCKGE